MSATSFWFIRHAIVAEASRALLYGTMDVPLCPENLHAQRPLHGALANHLPQPATWVISGLSRTRRTAAAIFAAGYPEQKLLVEPDLIEQSLGAWQGFPHAELPPKLTLPPHAFWPLGGTERPPQGESMQDVIARVGRCLDRLADTHAGADLVVVSHGGTIRAAVAHALRIAPDNALHLSVHNLSLTRLERLAEGWRVGCVNQLLTA
jgi:broad specificity phosphatase PhoE